MPETVMPSVSSVMVTLGNASMNSVFPMVEEQPVSRHISWYSDVLLILIFAVAQRQERIPTSLVGL